MSYCKECGKELERNAKFCRYCGTRVTVKELKTSEEPKALKKAPLKTEKIIIATIVPVVVAVVIIAVLLAHSGGSGGLGGRGAPPNALLAVSAHKVTSTAYTLTISHEGGDDMNVADLQIQASTSAATMTTYDFGTLTGKSGTFSVGNTVTTGNIAYSPDVTGQVVTVYIINKPSKEKIFSSSTVAVQG